MNQLRAQLYALLDAEWPAAKIVTPPRRVFPQCFDVLQVTSCDILFLTYSIRAARRYLQMWLDAAQDHQVDLEVLEQSQQLLRVRRTDGTIQCIESLATGAPHRGIGKSPRPLLVVCDGIMAASIQVCVNIITNSLDVKYFFVDRGPQFSSPDEDEYLRSIKVMCAIASTANDIYATHYGVLPDSPRDKSERYAAREAYYDQEMQNMNDYRHLRGLPPMQDTLAQEDIAANDRPGN